MLENETSAVAKQDYKTEIQIFERGLLEQLDALGLPSNGVLVPVLERARVFANIPAAIERLPMELRLQSIYVSKFLAAVASGLFDAALNYLWDETIRQLRRRVANYDVSYFFDQAIGSNQDKRKRLKNADDLDELDDSELIHGARQTELISDIGYRHLDYIRFMRNWASAAHPNQNILTGLQISSWLQTCIDEVISKPMTTAAAEIKKFLVNIRETVITAADARESALFFQHLTQEQANNLASGLFGIYTRSKTGTEGLANINHVMPLLWPLVDDETRNNFGVRYGKFAANNDQAEKARAKRFLELVNGLSYLPESLRVADVETAIDELLTAHRNLNNFHSEPTFARQLSRLTDGGKSVPRQIRIKYTICLVDVYLTNGNGTCHIADPMYANMIQQFTPGMGQYAISAFTRPHISSKLQFDICKNKYLKLLKIVETSITSPIVHELIEKIRAYQNPFQYLSEDGAIRRKLEAVQAITP